MNIAGAYTSMSPVRLESWRQARLISLSPASLRRPGSAAKERVAGDRGAGFGVGRGLSLKRSEVKIVHGGGKELTERSRGLGYSYTTKSVYDHAGRVTREYNSLDDSVSSDYDALGRLAASTDYMGNTTTYSYDSLGRLLRQESPFGAGESSEALYTYDETGNVTSTKTSSGLPGGEKLYRATENEYDSRGRLVLTRSLGGSGWEYAAFAYDAEGNQTDVYSGGREASPGSVAYKSHTTAAYDHFGNVVKRADA